MSRRGGLLVTIEGKIAFVPISVVARVVAMPPLTPVLGAPANILGIAHDGGDIFPVLAIGPSRDNVILCNHMGELVGLAGADVVSSGHFEVDESGSVIHRGQIARTIYVAALVP